LRWKAKGQWLGAGSIVGGLYERACGAKGGTGEAMTRDMGRGGHVRVGRGEKLE